ncbi:MAG TPA: hypothetical protein DCL60_05650, partial [Armatimonadetes bacterium]|nr:hypothetical protein [Armatimonadota bacterium]
ISILSGEGTVWVDDAALFECNADYSTKVNANYLWQPDFEEWNPSKLRLSAMWRLEERLTEYRKMGITQQLCIFDYKLWDPNPKGWYSRFFGDTWWQAGSKSGTQQNMALRYLAARFGHYTSLFAFELTNEMNPNRSLEKEEWVKSKSEYIKSIDPYGHIITNSYWNSPASISYEQMKCLDINQEHFYMVDETKSSQVPVWGNLSPGASLDTDQKNAKSGRQSLKLVGCGQDGGFWVRPSCNYTFRFWAKSPGSTVYGYIREYNQAGKQLSIRKIPCSGASYTLQTLDFRTDSSAASVVIEFNTPGTAWVDD